MQALDHMIANDLCQYSCSEWHREPDAKNYRSIEKIHGQVDYRGRIFCVFHQPKVSARGNMGGEEPSYIHITMVKLSSAVLKTAIEDAVLLAFMSTREGFNGSCAIHYDGLAADGQSEAEFREQIEKNDDFVELRAAIVKRLVD